MVKFAARKFARSFDSSNETDEIALCDMRANAENRHNVSKIHWTGTKQ